MKASEKKQAENSWINYKNFHLDTCKACHENNFCLRAAFLAGYQEAFEVGLIKGSMEMQACLNDDYHFPVIKKGS